MFYLCDFYHLQIRGMGVQSRDVVAVLSAEGCIGFITLADF
jgi:hypothetical protein